MNFCRESDVSLFNMLSRFVIAFLPRSMRLLISWLCSPSTVILEPKKIKRRRERRSIREDTAVLQGWLSGSTDTWRPHRQDVEFFPSHALRQSNIPQVPPTSSVLSSYSPLDPRQHWKLPPLFWTACKGHFSIIQGTRVGLRLTIILKYWSQV